MAARDPELIDELEFPPEGFPGDFAAKQTLVSLDEADEVLRGFVEEFEPESSYPRRQQTSGVVGTGLSSGVEDRVATAGVGLEGVLGANPVSKSDLVLVAGTPAIPIILAGGKEGAEHAMLHVKHGHVLVERDFEPTGRSGANEVLELIGVEIVTGGNVLQTEFSDEVLRGQRVGDVEREIADAPEIGEGVQMFVVSNENAVWVAGAHLVENPFLPGFEDPRGCDEDGQTGGAVLSDEQNGVAKALGVFELAIDGRRSCAECRLELGHGSHEQCEFGFGGRRGRGGGVGRRNGLEARGIRILLYLPPRRLGALLLELVDQFPSETIEFADGQENGVGEAIVDAAESEGRASETSELLGEARGIERLLSGHFERHRRLGPGDRTGLVARDDCHRLAGSAMNLEMNGPLVAGRFTGKTLPESLLQLGIAGLPKAMPRLDLQEIHGTPKEGERGFLASGVDFKDAASLLIEVRTAGIEYHAIPGRDRCDRSQPDAIAIDTGDFTEEHAALLAETGMDETLIVDPLEPTGK